MTRENKKVPALGWIEPMSKLLDSSFKIPGTNFKFGLDPIIGTIPVLGDLSTFLISAMIFNKMAKHGASRKVVILMSLNLIIDLVVGSIPLIGWLFDFGFRANDKNVRLLKEHYLEGKHQGNGSGVVSIITITLLAVFALVCIGIYKLFWLGYEYFK